MIATHAFFPPNIKILWWIKETVFKSVLWKLGTIVSIHPIASVHMCSLKQKCCAQPRADGYFMPYKPFQLLEYDNIHSFIDCTTSCALALGGLWTTRTQDNSYPGQLVPKTTRTQDNSYPRQLVPRTTRTQDNSYPGQLVPKTTRTQDNSYPRQLVPKTTRAQDNSYPGQLVPRTTRTQQFSHYNIRQII